MSELNYADLQVGDEIPSYTTPSISRTTLALFAGASGDHNPMHIDIDFAKNQRIIVNLNLKLFFAEILNSIAKSFAFPYAEIQGRGLPMNWVANLPPFLSGVFCRKTLKP